MKAWYELDLKKKNLNSFNRPRCEVYNSNFKKLKVCTILLWFIIISFGYKGNNYTSLKQFFAARKEKRMQTYLNTIKLISVKCRALLCWNKKLLWFFVIACSCFPRRNYFLTRTKLSSNFNMPILYCVLSGKSVSFIFMWFLTIISRNARAFWHCIAIS